MTTIVTRASNGAPLTNTQMDTNLTNLNNDKIETSVLPTLAPKASPAFTGIPTAPTAVPGTATTQIATTAFVSTSTPPPFPAGTRMVFAQAAAPNGWTQDTSDNATNRMLRVVNTAGGGVGGSSDPVLMNVVPSHTHFVQTGDQSADHAHSGATGYMNQNASHAHTAGDYGHAHSYGFPNNAGLAAFGGAGPGAWQGDTAVSYASVYVNGTDTNHTHNFSTGGVSANHYHTGTTNANTGAANWAPRYVDLIICQKN